VEYVWKSGGDEYEGKRLNASPLKDLNQQIYRGKLILKFISLETLVTLEWIA
jgi:hypothetical protein